MTDPIEQFRALQPKSAMKRALEVARDTFSNDRGGHSFIQDLSALCTLIEMELQHADVPSENITDQLDSAVLAGCTEWLRQYLSLPTGQKE